MHYKEVHFKSQLEHTKYNQLRRDHPTAWVIAQQYFSTTFISLCFHCHKEKFGMILNFFFPLV